MHEAVSTVLEAVPGSVWLTAPVGIAVAAVLSVFVRHERLQQTLLIESVRTRYGVTVAVGSDLDATAIGRRHDVKIADPDHPRGVLEIVGHGMAKLYVVQHDGSVTEYPATAA